MLSLGKFLEYHVSSSPFYETADRDSRCLQVPDKGSYPERERSNRDSKYPFRSSSQ